MEGGSGNGVRPGGKEGEGGRRRRWLPHRWQRPRPGWTGLGVGAARPGGSRPCHGRAGSGTPPGGAVRGAGRLQPRAYKSRRAALPEVPPSYRRPLPGNHGGAAGAEPPAAGAAAEPAPEGPGNGNGAGKGDGTGNGNGTEAPLTAPLVRCRWRRCGPRARRRAAGSGRP